MPDAHPIRAYRDRTGLTQDGLGDQVGVSGAAISRWEQGLREPRGKRLKKLCEVTGLSPAEVLNASASAATPAEATQ